MVVIRKADESDFPAILMLIMEFALFQKTPEKCTTTVVQMTEDKDLFQCFVAEVDANIIGFASFFFAYYSWSGKALYLDDLYITADYRRQNIGTSLLHRVRQLAIQENCKKLRWQVSNWNMDAIRFYKEWGASIDWVEINCDLDLSQSDDQDQPDYMVAHRF